MARDSYQHQQQQPPPHRHSTNGRVSASAASPASSSVASAVSAERACVAGWTLSVSAVGGHTGGSSSGSACTIQRPTTTTTATTATTTTTTTTATTTATATSSGVSRVNGSAAFPAPPSTDTTAQCKPLSVTPARIVAVATLAAALAAVPVLSQPANGCVFNPTNSECINYRLKPLQSVPMLQDICDEAPQLPACTIRRICASDPVLGLSDYCSPFKLLSDACYVDGSSLRGCRTWTQLCRPASLVRQCATEGPAAGLPSESTIRTLLSEVCSVVWGEPCDACIGSASAAQRPPTCEPLAAYSLHCRNLTSIPSCGPWETFCSAAPPNLLPLCDPPPPPPTPPRGTETGDAPIQTFPALWPAGVYPLRLGNSSFGLAVSSRKFCRLWSWLLVRTVWSALTNP
ncbi:hypothetical protein DFJ73DRAFT_485089 [Zopfochytrium polystomum]|nr:hypothetical protein DFJ73DRAFT_485089 [Zopfochytrium polystomum]